MVRSLDFYDFFLPELSFSFRLLSLIRVLPSAGVAGNTWLTDKIRFFL